MRLIEKPEVATKVIDKKTLFFNIRESRLSYMFHRDLITHSEYEAGSRYRRMCEIATLGSGSSIKDTRIGSNLTSIMKLICWQNYGIIEIANQLNITERRASNMVHDGLRALTIYYGYEKVRNTIRGQGTKVKRPKIS